MTLKFWMNLECWTPPQPLGVPTLSLQCVSRRKACPRSLDTKGSPSPELSHYRQASVLLFPCELDNELGRWERRTAGCVSNEANIQKYAVESKLGPKIAFLESKLGPSVSCVLFFHKASGDLQGEWDFKEKLSQKKAKKNTDFLSQNLVQFCWATYLDQVLTQPWSTFWVQHPC